MSKNSHIKYVERQTDNRFLNMYHLGFEDREGNPRDYYFCTRNSEDKLKIKTHDLTPEGICIYAITAEDHPRLVVEREYRFPVDEMIYQLPAGLIDPQDGADGTDPRIAAAKREIREETGIVVKDSDTIYVASPFVFSSPGMSDESNAMICAIVDLPDLSSLNTEGSEGTEVFGDYSLYTKAEAKAMLESGRDDEGLYYTIYTWAALMYFVYET